MCVSVYGDLTLLHDFKQGSLRLSGCAVDLVYQYDIGKNRPLPVFEV